ncbi:MAG TPA: N-methyl-L-tryptophan oxidase [Ramlibacter sp.]|nr:N-methyl-L-tryptophan oxidase [Ramlibacter sp.]
MNATAFDAVIVGAGSMGMAAGYYLSRAGQRVVLLDPDDPPHGGASHHGHTRLIRHAYGEGAAYVPLALRAHELWFDLERLAHTKLFERTGIINAAPEGHPFIAEVQRSASQYGLGLQCMDGAQANQRWPAWQLPADHAVCFEADAGVLYCEKAVGAFRRLATAQGAVVRANTAVTRIDPHPDGTASAITATGEAITGRHVIVCAGKRTRALIAPLGLDLPVTRVRKIYGWFDADPHLFGPRLFPGFAVLTELGMHYGFPSLEGRGLKAGVHDGGQPVPADAGLAPFGAKDLADIEVFLRKHLPGSGNLQTGETCEYDMTPDEHFIVDSVPGLAQVHFATGFSGHGFKFSTAIGEALAQRITQGGSTSRLSHFSSRRFAKT